MTWRTSSGGIASRSTVYFGFFSSNLSTNFSASLSKAAVSVWPTNILMTSPSPDDDPPQPTVPSSAAAASPPPPNLKKSFRLTVLLVFRTLSSFSTLRLRTSPTPRRSLTSPPCRLQHPLRRQDARTRYTGRLVELAQDYGKVSRRERQRAVIDGTPDLRQKRVADVRNASPDHDEGRVERADEGGQHLSHEPPRLLYDLERMVVSEGRRFSDVLRVERAALLEDLPQNRRDAFLRAFLRFGGYCGSGSHRFEASLVAARADRPFRVGADVSYVPGAPLASALQMPVSDDASADARAYLDEEHVVFALSYAVPVLAQCHHVHVVVNEDRGFILACERRAYGKPVPTRHDRGAPQYP